MTAAIQQPIPQGIFCRQNREVNSPCFSAPRGQVSESTCSIKITITLYPSAKHAPLNNTAVHISINGLLARAKKKKTILREQKMFSCQSQLCSPLTTCSMPHLLFNIKKKKLNVLTYLILSFLPIMLSMNAKNSSYDGRVVC